MNEVPVNLASHQIPACCASGPVFKCYDEVIMDDERCCTELDHAVTTVGYRNEDGKQYLIVRNSWGADWGEGGYIRMALNGDGRGVCGVLLDSTTVEVV